MFTPKAKRRSTAAVVEESDDELEDAEADIEDEEERDDAQRSDPSRDAADEEEIAFVAKQTLAKHAITPAEAQLSKSAITKVRALSHTSQH